MSGEFLQALKKENIVFFMHIISRETTNDKTFIQKYSPPSKSYFQY
jgi:hypothetical protein